MRELFDEAYGQGGLDPEEAVRTSTRGPQRKRFYTKAGFIEIDGSYAITLDDKAVRTPSRKPLVAPSVEIAAAIVAEWDAQQDLINPMTMPLTRLANSVIDAVGENVDAVIDDMAKYFGTDLLFYRAGHPQELVAREAAAWDPVLFWASEDLGAHFMLSEGIIHVKQPDTAIAAMRATLPSDPWTVAALHLVTTITGSAILAVALLRGRLDADQVWAAAHVDEDWNVERWGIDEEVAHRRAGKQVDFLASAAAIKALSPPIG
jgi:chaperone required for assembly of F1-ATPase